MVQVGDVVDGVEVRDVLHVLIHRAGEPSPLVEVIPDGALLVDLRIENAVVVAEGPGGKPSLMLHGRWSDPQLNGDKGEIHVIMRSELAIFDAMVRAVAGATRDWNREAQP